MLLNKNKCIIGENVYLIPYNDHLVNKYHNWMQSEYLLEATASERLTLEEEYSMQKTWQNDNDKLTFIICDLNKIPSKLIGILSKKEEEISMIGDVNIFIKDDQKAEIEIMIAENNARRKGFARETLNIFMKYVLINLSFIKCFEAKIGEKNISSINLFKSLGFLKKSECHVFKEITFELLCNVENFKKINFKQIDYK